MNQPLNPPDPPVPPDRAESLELAKSYRDFARYYFTVRSNASYLNIVAAGTFTYFFAQRLVDTPGESIVSALTTGYWMYAVGCIAFIAFALWAMSICNLLSNSFFSYMLMTRALEKNLGVTYPQKRWAVTFEFLDEVEQDKEGRKDITGNVWNFLNAFLVLYGLYALCLISLLASQWVMLTLGAAAFGYGYYRLVKFVADVEADKTRRWYRKDQARLWAALVAFLLINAWFLFGIDMAIIRFIGCYPWHC